MRYSQLFGKTLKSVPRDMEQPTSQALLYKGGFIRESTAGRYFFLPLGMRVRQKIMTVIKEEMDAIDSQEIIAPTLHPLELWEESNRDNETGFELMIVKDRREKEFALGGTAEEMMVDLVRRFQLSYRDFPISIYQFSQKFRDELRARGGLLRVREFMMKDAYTFDVSEEAFASSYQKMWDAYVKIFNRLALSADVVPADNGYIGGSSSHEFIVENSIGESRYFISEDGSYIAHEDIATFHRESMNPDEEIKDMETISQPEWVKTMEDNQKHYEQPAWRFLKNVVFRNRVNDNIYIVVIRGDLDVNKTKLEHVVGAVGQLEEAMEEDLKKMGTQPGYVHSWGHMGATYVADLSLKTVTNFIGGHKTGDSDTINVNYGRDFESEIFADVALAKEGYLSVSNQSPLIEKQGIEVGNIFNIGFHYTQRMNNAVFTGEDDSEQEYYMGSYGIGVDRTLATIVESHHDERGIVWPHVVAPYQVHLFGLKGQLDQAEHIYADLQQHGFDVLFDDRQDVSAGEQLADADLIGIPVRCLISDKSIESGGVEVKLRSKEGVEVVSFDNLVSYLDELLQR